MKAGSTRGAGSRAAVREWWLASRGVVAAAAGIWLATRLAFLLLTYVAVALRPAHGSLHETMLATWQHWDTNWFLLVSRRGYFSPASTAFFPLYPALVGALSWLLGDGGGPAYPSLDLLRLSAALVVSNLAALAAFVGLALLAVHERGSESFGSRAVLILAAYPFAFFLAAGYSDSVYLALAVFCFYCARRGSWWLAAVLAFASALSRVTAVALVVPLAWEFGRQRGWWRWLAEGFTRRSTPLAAGIASLAAVPIGIGLFAGYLAARYHDPLLFSHVNVTHWHRQFLPVWSTVDRQVRIILASHVGTEDSAMATVDLAAVVGFVVVQLAAIRRQPLMFTLYVLGVVFLDVVAPRTDIPDLFASISRHLVGAFPVFLVIAGWSETRRWLESLWLSAGFMLQALFCLAFLSGRPIF